MKMRSAGTVVAMILVVGLLAIPVVGLDTVIGETEISLNGERQHVRTQETNLGNLVADMLRYYTNADIAVYNGGGIRTSADLGEITLEKAMEIMAFSNEVVVLRLSGSTIIEALEHGVSSYGFVSGKFLQVSGIRMYIDPSKPAGERVVSVLVHGEPLVLDQLYTLATNDYLGYGGDGYTMFVDAELVEIMEMTDQQMFIEYIKTFSPLFPMVEGRIVVL